MKKKQISIYLILCVIILIIIPFYIHFFYIKNYIIKTGNKNNKITFGQTLSLTGKNSKLGESYHLGYLLAFQYINRKGGINNNFLELLVYNDEYDPEITLKNAKILVEYFNVFGILGSVGTMTSKNIMKYLSDRNILLIQPYSGSNLLREKFDKNIIFTKVSYYNEIRMVLKLLENKKKKNIGILYEENEFGLSVINDIQYEIILNKQKNLYNILSTGKYEKDNYLVTNGIKDLLKIDTIDNIYELDKSEILKKLEVVIILTTYDIALEAIEYLKTIKKDLYICCIDATFMSEVENKLKEINKEKTDNIYFIQSIPDLKNTNKNIYNDIIEEIKYYDKKENEYTNSEDESINSTSYKSQNIKINNVLYEGYLNGLFLINVIKKMKDNITVKNFKDVLYSNKIINVNGINFGPFLGEESCKNLNKLDCPCNTGLNKLYLYKYDGNYKKFIFIKENDFNVHCNRN
jgi:hypothetical protein